jgi:hypothetical protein
MSQENEVKRSHLNEVIRDYKGMMVRRETDASIIESALKSLSDHEEIQMREGDLSWAKKDINWYKAKLTEAEALLAELDGKAKK